MTQSNGGAIAIIQARMSSTRLPGKVLKTVLGRPLLSLMVERVRRATSLERVVVATSTSPEDQVIVDLCVAEGIDYYRGSLNDVLDRYYQAALQYPYLVVVRLTSDCPLMDPAVIDKVVGYYHAHSLDYCSNTTPPELSTFPDGMDVEVFSFQALERAWKEAKKPSEREHVTFFLWKNPQRFKTGCCSQERNLSHMRLTVDYPEDFELIREIFEAFQGRNGTFSLGDIVDLFVRLPALRERNAHIKPNQGWIPSLEKDKSLGFQ